MKMGLSSLLSHQVQEVSPSIMIYARLRANNYNNKCNNCNNNCNRKKSLIMNLKISLRYKIQIVNVDSVDTTSTLEVNALLGRKLVDIAKRKDISVEHVKKLQPEPPQLQCLVQYHLEVHRSPD